MNGAIFPKDVLKKAIDEFNSNVKNGKMIGELDHKCKEVTIDDIVEKNKDLTDLYENIIKYDWYVKAHHDKSIGNEMKIEE
jgi:hypothetical protein